MWYFSWSSSLDKYFFICTPSNTLNSLDILIDTEKKYSSSNVASNLYSNQSITNLSHRSERIHRIFVFFVCSYHILISFYFFSLFLLVFAGILLALFLWFISFDGFSTFPWNFFNFSIHRLFSFFYRLCIHATAFTFPSHLALLLFSIRINFFIFRCTHRTNNNNNN